MSLQTNIYPFEEHTWANNAKYVREPNNELRDKAYEEEEPFADDFNGLIRQHELMLMHVQQNGAFLPWDARFTYKTYSRVTGSDGLKYVSLVDNNKGNDPTKSPAMWKVDQTGIDEAPADGKQYIRKNKDWDMIAHSDNPDLNDSEVLASTKATFNHNNDRVAHSKSLTWTGMIAIHSIDGVPDGWLDCNGAAVSRTTYFDLFASIGTNYGVGDGSTTFNIPDFRGCFLRGVGGNSKSIGYRQESAVGVHQHSQVHGIWLRSTYGGSNYFGCLGSSGGDFSNENYLYSPNCYITGYGLEVETRPTNYAVKYIIKY